MNLQVIIPSYRSAKTLLKTLSSIRTAHSGDIIVIDSTPHLGPTLRKQIENHRAQLIHVEDRLFAGKARNLGAQRAHTTDWLYFIDADCVWNQGWYESALVAIEAYPMIKAFNGPILYERPWYSAEFAFHLLEFQEFLMRETHEPRFLHSGNLLIRSDFFYEIGPFREDIPMSTDFTFAQNSRSKLKNQVCYLPSLSITHLAVQGSLTSYLKKSFRAGVWRGQIHLSLPGDLKAVPKEFLWLSPLFGFLWFLQMFRRLVFRPSLYRIWAIALSPLCFPLAVIWGIGFFKGLRQAKKSELTPSSKNS